MKGSPHPCVLGSDFLSGLGPVILDLSQRAIIVGGERIAMTANHLKDRPRSRFWEACASEEVEIPGRHETLVMAVLKRTPSPQGKSTVLFEPNSLEHGLLMAWSLSCPNQDQIPVRVMNVGPHPTKLYKGTRLGKATIYEEQRDEVLTVSKQTKSGKTLGEQQHLLHPKKHLEGLDLTESDLAESQKHQLRALLEGYADVFAADDSDLGHTGQVKHQIDTGDHPPIK
jgi:hypothetical protein